MRGAFTVLCAVVGLAWALPATGTTLTFVPPTQTVFFGDTFVVDLVISDVSPTDVIGSFDLDVLFPGSQFEPLDVQFGPFLGDPSDPLQTLVDVTLFFGRIDLAEVSLLLTSELEALQPDSFILASLFVRAERSGVGRFSIAPDALIDDGFGVKLPVTVSDATITVVPEPGIPALFSIAAMILLARRALL